LSRLADALHALRTVAAARAGLWTEREFSRGLRLHWRARGRTHSLLVSREGVSPSPLEIELVEKALPEGVRVRSRRELEEKHAVLLELEEPQAAPEAEAEEPRRSAADGPTSRTVYPEPDPTDFAGWERTEWEGRRYPPYYVSHFTHPVRVRRVDGRIVAEYFDDDRRTLGPRGWRRILQPTLAERFHTAATERKHP
jgi:hypothetical protein